VEETKEVHFNDVQEFLYSDVQGNYTRHNVAVVARLKDLATRKSVCVASVHAFWDPSFIDVKLSQMMMLRGAVRDVAHGVPSFIAGDFNAVPGSETYVFMLGRNVARHGSTHVGSSLEKAASRLKSCIPPDRLKDFVRRFGEFESPNLSSAYGQYKRFAPTLLDVPKSFIHDIVQGWDDTDDPTYTTVTHKFSGCIDHVFFQRENVRLCGVLEIPPASHLFDEVKGLPNYHCPSDHLPIAAAFECL
jgi:mRNA deadenylase 3'-5' endonuclease subunit Ccr4